MQWAHAKGGQSQGSQHCSVSAITALVVTVITVLLLARNTLVVCTSSLSSFQSFLACRLPLLTASLENLSSHSKQSS